MPELSPLRLSILANTSPFIQGLNKARSHATSFAQTLDKTVSGAFRNLGNVLTSTAGQLGLISGAAGIGGFVAMSIKLAAEAEKTQIGFEVMLGSAEKASELIASINRMSVKTPFTPKELKESTSTLLGFGRAMDQVIDDMRMLGDLSQGDGQRLKQLALVYGQVFGMQRLQGQDALQLINAQVPIWQLLEKTMGKSVSEIRELSSEGKVSFEDMRTALQAATNEGGAFFRMSERMSGTLAGVFSTLKGNIELTSAGIGKALSESAKFTEILKNVNIAIEQIDQKRVADSIAEGVKSLNSALVQMLKVFRDIDYWVSNIRVGLIGLVSELRVGMALGLFGPGGFANAISFDDTAFRQSLTDAASKEIMQRQQDQKTWDNRIQYLERLISGEPDAKRPATSAGASAPAASQAIVDTVAESGEMDRDLARQLNRDIVAAIDSLRAEIQNGQLVAVGAAGAR